MDRQDLAQLPFIKFVPALSPEFREPWHLVELCEQFEQIRRGEFVRALVGVPIRHFKTQTMLHGLVWLLCNDPGSRWLLLSHSYERATALGKRARQLARAAGVGPARGQDTIADWSTEQGGGILIMSADQSRLGYDVHGLFFDDPIDEAGAQDPKKREEVDEAIAHYTARTMRKGKPGPVVGIMSRWHPDDPIGRRLMRTAVDWKYIHYGAIVTNNQGEERAFAPEVWPLEELRKMRAELAERDPGERIWWAQLMNDPKPMGAELFRDPARWDTPPPWTFRVAYGADLAFTQGDHSDYFAMVAAKIYGTKCYVQEVQRVKLDAHMIESTAKKMLKAHGHGPIYSYMSGPEIGMAKLMIERGLPFVPMRARYNKLVRAERTIKRWNNGEVALPVSAPWLEGFLHRMSCFRGNDKDAGDDEADALVSLCDGAMGGVAAGSVKTLGKSYKGFHA